MASKTTPTDEHDEADGTTAQPQSLIDYMSTADLTAEDEIYPSPRFEQRGHAFTIRPLSPDANEALIKQCSKFDRRKGATELDGMAYNLALIRQCVVSPDFTSASWCERMGVTNPNQLIKAVLKPGEINAVAAKITELMGYFDDVQDAVAAAKN